MDFTAFFDDSDRKFRYWSDVPSLSAEAKSFSTFSSKEFASNHKKKIQQVAWNCTGDLLGSGSRDKTIKLFDPTTTRAVSELIGHSHHVWQLMWDPNSPNRLASAAKDQTVRLWDSRTAKATTVLKAEDGLINLCWSPQGNYIAVGDLRDVVSIIDLRTLKIMPSPKKFPYMVHGMTFDTTEKFLMLGTALGNVMIMRFPQISQCAYTIEAHTGYCYCVVTNKSGSLLATGGADALVQVWDTKEMVCKRTFSRLDFPVRQISLSHDSRFIASCCLLENKTASKSAESRIDISEVSSGHSVHTVVTNNDILSIAWSPVQNILAMGGAIGGGSSREGSGVVSLWGPGGRS
ncbi:hypothetical protein AAMO2058_000001200 [Amorphochlora amoebiformis]